MGPGRGGPGDPPAERGRGRVSLWNGPCRVKAYQGPSLWTNVQLP